MENSTESVFLGGLKARFVRFEQWICSVPRWRLRMVFVAIGVVLVVLFLALLAYFPVNYAEFESLQTSMGDVN